MKQWIEIWQKKNENDNYMEKNIEGKKIVGHSKLKLWTFFWGHGEYCMLICKINSAITIICHMTIDMQRRPLKKL